MKKIQLKSILAIVALTFVTISCKNEKKNDAEQTVLEVENTEAMEEVEEVEEVKEITIKTLQNSPSYADAALVLKSPENTKIANGEEVDFNFEVNNYELGTQTEGPGANMLANSGKGQHIHFILNNQPYSAHYEANFKKEIPDGVHHLVAFLSRSYHEAVKNENSVVVRKLEVGSNPEDAVGLDLDAPTLIYSRPKGEYSGKDTENLLLDFFVLNTTLSEDGNKVRASINGKEFLITEWAPQVINGLPMGEVTIILELIDNNGTLIAGPFNKVTRTVTLKE